MALTQDLPSDPPLAEADFLARAEAASGRDEHDLALRLWSEARSRFSNAPLPWLREAETLIELRRFGEADAVMDEAVRRFPDHFWLARTRALAARIMGDDVEAYTRCRALRQAFPDNPASHAAFIHLLLDLKQVAAAEAEAQASIALFPDVTWLHAHVRSVCRRGRRHRGCRRSLDRSAHSGSSP